MLCNCPQNGIECANSDRIVGGDGYSLMAGLARFENYVTADLMDLDILPFPTEDTYKMLP
ncbi:MAG: hypothetical protein JO138_13050 [Acidobacteriaceae bacterium]|nr:hypothetical protein [Acidobacteriaceae bacterium]